MPRRTKNEPDEDVVVDGVVVPRINRRYVRAVFLCARAIADDESIDVNSVDSIKAVPLVQFVSELFEKRADVVALEVMVQLATQVRPG